MAAGTGPRHLAFHPTLPIVYVAGELNSSVSLLRCDPQTAALSVQQTLIMRPAGFTARELSRRHSRRAQRSRALRLQSRAEQHRGVQRRSRHRHAHAHPGRLDRR